MSKTAHNEEFPLIITIPANKFEKHLELPSNKRIVFSGIYGCGKTYFLNDFFKNFKPNPNVIHIYPNNYAVAKNEDIFEYLKHDILFELFCMPIDFEKIKFSGLSKFQSFILNTPNDFFTPFIEILPHIGKPLSKIIKNLQKFWTEFSIYRRTIDIDKEKEIKNYLESFALKPGTIYEENFYTQVIQELITKIKEDSNQETILIIDDLDRLDPDHIFRLLNVFAAHIQFLDDENKFGFDKIIMVFDFENVRNIFHNRYGENVDFAGYIDKFYSYEVFHFDNKEIVIENLKPILNKIDLSANIGISINFKLIEQNYFSRFVHFILTELIELNVINLRILLRLIHYKYTFEQKHISFKLANGQEKRTPNWYFPLIMLFDFLIKIFGSIQALELVINSCSRKSLPSPDSHSDSILTKNLIIGSATMLLDYTQHGCADGETEHIYTFENLGISCKYKFYNKSMTNHLFIARADSIFRIGDENQNLISNFNHYKIFTSVLNELKELKVVKY